MLLILSLHVPVAHVGLKNLKSIAVGINRDWCILKDSTKDVAFLPYGREAAMYVQASRLKIVARVSIDSRS